MVWYGGTAPVLSFAAFCNFLNVPSSLTTCDRILLSDYFVRKSLSVWGSCMVWYAGTATVPLIKDLCRHFTLLSNHIGCDHNLSCDTFPNSVGNSYVVQSRMSNFAIISYKL